MDTIILIDGNSLINRAFYAIPELTNKEGKHTNAIYGFANILFKIIQDYNPKGMAVAFDLKKPTFRHKMYDEYKAGRKKMPQELFEQMAPLKEMLGYFGIETLELEGFEADDIIGTVSKICEESNYKVYIITGDRDSFQLASDKTTILFTKRGISSLDKVDYDNMIQTYGITPTEFIDLKALMGDSSDNIPGVKGVGEKTGLKLIKEYKTIENIYQNIDNIKGSLQKKLIEDEETAYMSKTLATIVRNIPLDIDVENLHLKPMDTEKLNKFFADNSMLSLQKKLIVQETIPTVEDIVEMVEEENPADYELIKDIDKLKEEVKDEIYIKTIRKPDIVTDKSIISIIIRANKKNYLVEENEIPQIKSILEDSKIKKYGYDLKSDFLALLAYDVYLDNLNYDLMIAAYLLDPSASSYDIQDISIKLGLGNIASEEEFFGKGKNKKEISVLIKEEVQTYYTQILIHVEKSKEIILKRLQDEEMIDLFNNIEMPLVKVLGHMEYYGVKVDVEELKTLQKYFMEKIDSLQSQIYEYAGEEFNINSPKQLGVILFEKLNLPVSKKTKTGYSTNQEVLEFLADKHPIVPLISEYRLYTKLQSTYCDGLLNIINQDTGRIHSSFNQTITATGRISSTEPNLQNIPVRLEVGRNLRKVFVSDTGKSLVDADYSQIELRVLADMANEHRLIEAFTTGEDIHRKTASEVFNVALEDVTDEMRSAAKAVNFGIVYGISDFGLSNNLNIPVKQAKEYIQTYLATYKDIGKYMEDVVAHGKENGYVTTMFGRRRQIPQLKSRNFVVRNLGKRLAMNTPIQGTAADIIKIAMIKVYDRLKKEQLKSKLILQVHDELIVEAPEEEQDKVVNILREEMENAASLKVKLTVDINTGKSWYETK